MSKIRPRLALYCLFLFGTVLSVSACQSRQAELIHAYEQKSQASHAIHLCLAKIRRVTGNPLSSKADQAYVYLEDNLRGVLMLFTHGMFGAFQKRSADYAPVMDCGIIRKPYMDVVFLQRRKWPLPRPVYYAPGADFVYLGAGSTFTNSMELRYFRLLGKFRFQSKQRFSPKNFFKHNPELLKRQKCNLNPKAPPPQTPPSPEWMKKHPGCYLELQH